MVNVGDDHNFAEQFANFSFASLLTQGGVIVALDKVRNESNRVLRSRVCIVGEGGRRTGSGCWAAPQSIVAGSRASPVGCSATAERGRGSQQSNWSC